METSNKRGGKHPPWSTEDEVLLKAQYQTASESTLLCLFPNRTWCAIKQWARKLGVNRGRNIPWSKEEKVFLEENYVHADKEHLLAVLPHSWVAIVIMSGKLGITRSSIFYRESSLDSLLGEDLAAYYWAGFLAADGSINQKVMRLTLGLALKDDAHLLKFAAFIATDNVYRTPISIGVQAQDKDILPLFIHKFDFKQNKTENPPTLGFGGDKLLSFIVGFIDGDGQIKRLKNRPDSSILIKLHRSWLPVLELFEAFLYKELNVTPYRNISRCRINNQGYALFCITDRKICIGLKQFVLKNNLPVLSRKWELIDENLQESRYDTSAKLKEKIVALAGSHKNGEIATMLGISDSRVSVVLKERRCKDDLLHK